MTTPTSIARWVQRIVRQEERNKRTRNKKFVIVQCVEMQDKGNLGKYKCIHVHEKLEIFVWPWSTWLL